MSCQVDMSFVGTPFQAQFQEMMIGFCTRVWETLTTDWTGREDELDRELEMERLEIEQVYRALTDPLNRLGTGEEIGDNPLYDPKGAHNCVMHFIAWAGHIFRKEFEEGLV